MNFNIIATPRFRKELKRLSRKFPSLKTEYASLIGILETEPETGTPLGYDCFKIRLSIKSKGKGKSGGARVITNILVQNKTVYLLTIYDKSERNNISDIELKLILREL